MTETGYASLMSAPPIRAIIIQPDNSYEIKEIGQDLATFKTLVGGHLEAFSSYCCTFWFNEEGLRLELPYNSLATHLWWLLCPEMEGRDVLRGPVFVTGLPDDASDSQPVSDEVVTLLRRVESLTDQ